MAAEAMPRRFDAQGWLICVEGEDIPPLMGCEEDGCFVEDDLPSIHRDSISSLALASWPEATSKIDNYLVSCAYFPFVYAY